MQTRILAAAACAVGLQITAQVEIYDTGTWADIRVAAQGTDGAIRAAGVGSSWCAWNWNENWQPGYNNSPWNAWGSSDTGGAVPTSMDQAGDGSVISLWESRTDASVLVLLQSGSYGGTARLAGIRGPAARVRVLMDSQTNLWVTEAGVNICQAVNRKNNYHRETPPLVHAITVGELWPDGNATNRLPVSIVEDARGRIWFWSNCLLGDDSRGAIRGVLLCENGLVTNLPALQGVPEGRISVIAPMDRTNLWLAVRNEGIFSVNLDTLVGTRVTDPETNRFPVVQQIFSVGQDCYVISGNPFAFNANGRRSVLWRWRSGQWTKLIDGLDAGDAPEQLADRPWRITKEGLWLGAFGLGGWFVSLDDGASQVINWQKNSPFDTINRWLQLKDGRLLGLEFGRGGILADPALLAQKPVKPPTTSIVFPAKPLVRTVEGKVFAVLRGDWAALQEWDGQQWVRHPFPSDAILGGQCRITCDSKGRVWFVDAANYNDPAHELTYIFDPGGRRFQKFQSFRSALQAQAGEPVTFGDSHPGTFAPEFSSDGRVCYEGNWGVNYFDGQQWRAWNQANGIMPGEYLRSGQDNQPFFDRDGKLSVVLNDSVWQLDDLSGWKKSSLRSDAAHRSAAGNEMAAPPPYAPDADAIVADEHGVYWIVAHRQLFRASHGRQAACFAPNVPQPFADGRKLAGVLTDNSGTVFLQTSLQGRQEYVLLPASLPLPHTTVKLLENGDDGVTLQLSANLPAPRFSWRVDEAPWSEAGTNQILRLEELAAGHHLVQVSALDAQLQTNPTPAQVAVEIHSDPAKKIKKWVAQLGDKNFDRREAAIKNLSRQAEAARPVLRQARDQETDSERRWWLEAALQQCQ